MSEHVWRSRYRTSPARDELEEQARSQAPRGHSLLQALTGYLKNEGLADLSQLATIQACWQDVVGADIAQHCQPWALHGHELTIAVDQPAWATELKFQTATIIEGLQSHVGHEAVLRLKMHVRG